MLPNQSYKNIDIEEDIQRTTFNELEDEFATINMLTLDLISVISRQNQKLQDLYKAPGDYKKLMEQLKNDDEEYFIQGNDDNENADDDDDSGYCAYMHRHGDVSHLDVYQN